MPDFTYEDVKEACYDIMMDTPRYRAEYERYLEILVTWIQKEAADGCRPIEIAFALEYVAAVCHGEIDDIRIKFQEQPKIKHPALTSGQRDPA